ncbi:MAG: nucleotidyltransferase family protein [Oscillospiraceae bacterium]|nr:nucleotidyltransferase family protein [Oscillospiraceae bacterium]
MNAVGIVAEYNPFHSGHAYQLAQTRRLLGEDRPVVCVMSGSWVQRGECALTDKWTRAAMALEGGADLILELPLPWAISSAEGFARGAVAALKATGVVDALSFGSESGDLAALKRIAAVLDSPEYRDILRAQLGRGDSFALVRQRAAQELLGREGSLLQSPNDSLGVEYLRAAGGELAAVAVPRLGAAHDSPDPEGGYASATYLRERLRRGEEASAFLGGGASKLLNRAGIARMEHIERGILSRLRQMGQADWATLPDSGGAEGLPARLVKAAGQAESLEEFYARAKTRRYAHARIRRLALWAFLELKAEDRPASGPAYLRVLGMNSRGKGLLREMKGRAELPILTKPAHIRELGDEAQALFALECRGTDLFGLCFDKIKPCGADYTTGPVIL